MQQILNKLLNIFLIFILSFLILNEYYVIEFSVKLKNIFIFLGLILMLIITIKEIISSSSKLSKFVNGVTICCIIIGGILVILTNELNMFVYVSIFFSLIFCLTDLIYKKS